MNARTLEPVRAIIFDLDGTLIDSVYSHTLAWQQTLSEHGTHVAGWEIHRRIGISGRLLLRALADERKLSWDDRIIEQLSRAHASRFKRYRALCQPLPGATELIEYLTTQRIGFGIATTGKRSEVANALKALHLPEHAVVIDGSSVEQTKPEPELFVRCQQALGSDRSECLVVGDSVWDVHAARRAGILSVGLLTGGFGEQELYNAGAMRVYESPAYLQSELSELGFETTSGRPRPARTRSAGRRSASRRKA